MKKINPEVLEKMAKEKNIDKDKIEKIADSYKGKSEDELVDELVKIGKTLQGREEVVSKFKSFLDENQQKKLDSIMKKISDAEIQSKIDSKKSKSKKTTNSNVNNSNSSNSMSKKTKSHNNNDVNQQPTSSKKVKKVIKKTKRPR